MALTPLCTVISMFARATGILRSIQAFFHGRVSPPARKEADDLSFLNDPFLRGEIGQVRTEGLLFSDGLAANRERLLREMSDVGRFAEKHAAPSEFDLMVMSAQSKAAQDKGSDVIFEPARQAGTSAGERGGPAAAPAPAPAWQDPLEDLYEPFSYGPAPAAGEDVRPSYDLYSVFLRKRREKKPE